MKLFYDDEFDAIQQAISGSGKDFKSVAGHMFPDMKPESAYARLKACCSPTGDQRLTFGQVLRRAMTGGLLLDISGSQFADPDAGFQAGDRLAIASIVASMF